MIDRRVLRRRCRRRAHARSEERISGCLRTVTGAHNCCVVQSGVSTRWANMPWYAWDSASGLQGKSCPAYRVAVKSKTRKTSTRRSERSKWVFYWLMGLCYMNITFSLESPAAESFKNLYDTTNWGAIERDVGFYADALGASWASVSAYDEDRLVAFARAISDGKLHAFITEMIVHPEYQRRNLGEQLLKLLVDRCHLLGVEDIQLFCAKGKADFYLKNGFSRRPDDAPGMQYSGALKTAPRQQAPAGAAEQPPLIRNSVSART